MLIDAGMSFLFAIMYHTPSLVTVPGMELSKRNRLKSKAGSPLKNLNAQKRSALSSRGRMRCGLIHSFIHSFIHSLFGKAG